MGYMLFQKAIMCFLLYCSIHDILRKKYVKYKIPIEQNSAAGKWISRI
jgi:hypothetical protein